MKDNNKTTSTRIPLKTTTTLYQKNTIEDNNNITSKEYY